jgi:hypothetical protein
MVKFIKMLRRDLTYLNHFQSLNFADLFYCPNVLNYFDNLSLLINISVVTIF